MNELHVWFVRAVGLSLIAFLVPISFGMGVKGCKRFGGEPPPMVKEIVNE